MTPQPLDPLFAPALEPLAHRPLGHPQRSGDVLLFPALLFQLPGASPPSFAPVQPGFLGIHRPNIPLLYQPVQGSVGPHTTIKSPESLRTIVTLTTLI